MAIKFVDNEVYEAVVLAASEMLERLRREDLHHLRNRNGKLCSFGTFYDIFRPLYTTDRQDVILDELAYLYQRLGQRYNDVVAVTSPPAITREVVVVQTWLARFIITTLDRALLARRTKDLVDEWVDSTVKLVAMGITACYCQDGAIDYRRRYSDTTVAFDYADLPDEEEATEWDDKVDNLYKYLLDVVESLDVAKSRCWFTKVDRSINRLFIHTHPLSQNTMAMRMYLNMRATDMLMVGKELGEPFPKDPTIEADDYNDYLDNTLTGLIASWNQTDVYGPLTLQLLLREHFSDPDNESELYLYRHDILNLNHDADVAIYE